MKKEDSNFDIYKAPIGKWLAFNNDVKLDDETLNKELVEVIMKIIYKNNKKTETFNKRKEKLIVNDEVLDETKEDLEEMVKKALVLAKENNEDKKYYSKAICYNIEKCRKIFSEDISEKIMKEITDIGLDVK